MKEDIPDRLIDLPSYLVLEIPPPMNEVVKAYRARFDPARATLPVEITVTGSSGLGLLTLGQSLRHVADCLERFAARQAPFMAAFKGVERFEKTDIYFLTLEDETPFAALNAALGRSGIAFEPSPYPFRPHCTIKLRLEPDAQETLELLFLEIPHAPFLLDSIALYGLADANHCELLCRTKLRGASSDSAPSSGT